MTGVHDKEGDPCPRQWDVKWKIWNDSWKEHLTPAELKHYDQLVPVYE